MSRVSRTLSLLGLLACLGVGLTVLPSPASANFYSTSPDNPTAIPSARNSGLDPLNARPSAAPLAQQPQQMAPVAQQQIPPPQQYQMPPPQQMQMAPPPQMVPPPQMGPAPQQMQAVQPPMPITQPVMLSAQQPVAVAQQPMPQQQQVPPQQPLQQQAIPVLQPATQPPMQVVPPAQMTPPPSAWPPQPQRDPAPQAQPAPDLSSAVESKASIETKAIPDIKLDADDDIMAPPPKAKKGKSGKSGQATTSKKSKGKMRKAGDQRVYTVQMHLANLWIYKDEPDGIMGPKTVAAIKKFQKKHHLKVTGKVNKETLAAIEAADKIKSLSVLPIPKTADNLEAPTLDFYASHPDFYGYYDQQYGNVGMLGFPQNVYSRFASMQVSENMSSPNKLYNVTVNGQPLLTYEGQPTVIGVSRTYNLGNEDVIILTSYRPNNAVCIFAHHLLILNAGGHYLKEVRNCTRGYQARVANSSLFVTFPETDDNRDVGATWRYDKGDLQRL